jgi:hypothetical protein
MGDSDGTAPKYRPPSPRLTLPLTAEQLPENPGFNRIVVSGVSGPLPSEADWAVLAAYMRRYPQLGLYVDSELRDLEFLQHFPWLRTFSFLALGIESVDGLLHVAESLRILELSPTKRRLSLEVLRQLQHVHSLGVEGHWQGLNVLGDLPALRSLTLSNIKVDSLDFLRGATSLAMLFLRLGKVDDISTLASFPHLQELTVYRTKLGDLAPLSDCSQLAYLQLESVPATTLPDLSKLTQLKVLWLANLRDIDDLTPVAAAPNLRYLLVESKTLDPQAMAVLREHPTLEYLTAALGSKTRIAQAYEAAPYPDDDEDNYQFRFRRELAKQLLAEPEAT